MVDQYRCKTLYTMEEFTEEPGNIAKVKVSMNNMVIAILSPEEFAEQYELIVE